MDTQLQEVALASLGGGAAAEQFGVELRKVLANIADPNTEAKEPRDIVLKVRIVPNGERTHAAVRIACTSKMAATKPYGSVVFLSTDGHKVTAYEQQPMRQAELDLGSRVREFTGGEKA